MGAYNLLHIDVPCKNCKKHFDARLQFKCGDTWQYDYHVGDKLQVTFQDREIIGYDIVAYGIIENAACPFCGFLNQDEYSIYIDDCKITRIDEAIDITPFLDSNDGRFFLRDKSSE